MAITFSGWLKAQRPRLDQIGTLADYIQAGYVARGLRSITPTSLQDWFKTHKDECPPALLMIPLQRSGVMAPATI